MKLFAIVVLFVVVYTTQFFVGKAQDKGYIAISLGGSLPLGDYAKNSYDNSVSGDKMGAGFATFGMVADLSFNYKLTSQFGLLGQIGVITNGIDKDAYDKYLGSAVEINKSWSSAKVLIGVNYSFSMNKNLYVEPRVLIGILNVSAPEIWSSMSKNTSSSAVGFSYDIGVGARYNINNAVCLMGGIDYLGTGTNEIKGDVEVSGIGGNKYTSSYTMKQALSMINISVGVGYRL